MRYVHNMTIMIHTASCDNFLENQGMPSYHAAVLECLRRQTLKSFELVYVDTFYEDNRDAFERMLPSLPFIVKHVPVHKEHRYWFNRGNTYISAAKNTGIIYADGELCVTCDDAEFFPENFLETYWRHYKSGHLMLGMHKRMKSMKVQHGLPCFPIDGDIYINDHRLNNIKEEIHHHTNGTWGFAGTSFPLAEAVAMNGFNERMDGCKSLEDCEFSTRLQMRGRKFVQDKSACLFILDHQSYADMRPTNWEVAEGQDCQASVVPPTPIKKKKIDSLIAIENYGVYACTMRLQETKANCGKLTDEHMKIIREETLRYRKFDPLAPEHASTLRIWLGVPTFDLARQRKELRASKEWRW